MFAILLSIFFSKFEMLYSFQRKERLGLCYDLAWGMCVAVSPFLGSLFAVVFFAGSIDTSGFS